MSEVREPTHVHVAEIPPSACSACFGFYADRTYVDFGASWDGPFLTSQVTGGTAVSIDELVICDECLRTGARLIGMADRDELADRVDRQAAQLDEMGKRLADRVAYCDSLEKALQAKPRGRPPKDGRP